MKIKSNLILMALFTGTTLFTVSCGNKDKAAETKTHDHEHGTANHDHEHIYACPMHPEITGKEGDSCPKCGMKLVHMDEKPTAGNYKMEFRPAATTIEAGKPSVLAFIPRNAENANAVVPLDVEHEKKIHLIIVNEDLSWFDHIHPEYQSDGSFTVTETFPKGGRYTLYADYKPSGSTHQIEKIDIDVAGERPPLNTDYTGRITSESKPFKVTLRADEGKFTAGKPIHFDGVFTQSGKEYDVNSLQNYLGAKGHMVAINTTTREYIHLHPEVEGTILHFHTTFSKGTYRVWLQFSSEGKLHTTDFVINAE